jgi:tetratricopeptide (TPR) repeat protein
MPESWVNRDVELSVLNRWWETGREDGACILGEAGVGKTHLIEHFMEELRTERDFVPLVFDFDVNLSQGSMPLALTLERLYSSDRLLSQRVAAALKILLPEILNEFPIVGRLLGATVSRGFALQDAALHDLLFQSEYTMIQLVRSLERLRNRFGMLIVLDNLQWLDEFSYILIRRLAQSTGSRLRVIAAMRTENLAESSEHMQRARSLLSCFDWREIPLSPFDEKTVREYLELANPQENAKERVHEVFHLSGGLPLLVSCLATLPTRTLRSKARANAPSSLSRISIVLSAYFEQRLGTLHPDQRFLLRLLSVHDAPLESNTVQSAYFTGQGKRTLIEFASAVDLLVHRLRLLHEDSGHLMFRHRLLSEYIQVNMTDVAKREIHTLLAAALQESPELDSNPQIQLSIGNHLKEAGASSEAASWYLQAAEEYISLGLPLRAHHTITQMATPSIQQIPTSTRAMIVHTRINAAYAAGLFDDAISSYNGISQEESAALLKNGVISKTHLTAAMSAYYLNNNQEAFSFFKSSVEAAHQLEDRWHLHAGNLGMAACLDLGGKYKEARDVYESSCRIAESDGDEYQLARFQLAIQMVSVFPQETIEALLAALSTFRTRGALRDEAACLNNLGLEHLMRGELDLAERNLNDSVAAFARIQGIERNFPLNNLGTLYRYRGNLERSIQSLEKSVSGALSRLQKCFALTNMGISLAENNEGARAEAAFRSAYELSGGHVDPTTRIYTAFNLARFLLLRDQTGEAQSLLNESHAGPWKAQLLCLRRKREDLASQCGVIFSPRDPVIDPEIGLERRAAFVADAWEPAELVFFS